MSTKNEGSRPAADASSSFTKKKSKLIIGFGVVAALLWVSTVNVGGRRGLDTDHNIMPVQNMNVARHADKDQSAVASRNLQESKRRKKTDKKKKLFKKKNKKKNKKKDMKMQKKVSRIHRVLSLSNLVRS